MDKRAYVHVYSAALPSPIVFALRTFFRAVLSGRLLATMFPRITHRLRAKTTLMVEVGGDSSGSDGEVEAAANARACCGQFVWPCPRKYPADVAQRTAQKRFIPKDLGKPELGKLFIRIAENVGQGQNLKKVHVFDEPHKRYNIVTGQRERHKHVIFKMETTFAHIKFQKELAKRGVYGHFSFNLVGYVAYLRYCLCESPKKLPADLDQSPWSWPSVDVQKLKALCDKPTPQMLARNGVASGRKRKLLTFSEVTDVFVEAKVKTARDAWMVAKTRKTAGDEILWNTLGDTRCVSTLVQKVRTAWSCEAMSTGTLQTQVKYGMDKFVPLAAVSTRLEKWCSGDWKKLALILAGEGDLGKTKFACALVHHVSPAGAFHFVNKVDRLRDVTFSPGEGLVVDEVGLASRSIDDVKGLIDLEENRDVDCRNKDGHIPMETPRAFLTNWPWEQFWPREALGSHATPVTRRVLWIDVKKDLRLLPKPDDSKKDGRVLPIAGDGDEDVFGFGGGLDDEWA